MNSVKTYQAVNREQQDVHFGISKMEDIYTKRKGEVDEPHRHNFYTVLIIKKAKGEHKIDFNSYALGSNQLFFVSRIIVALMSSLQNLLLHCGWKHAGYNFQGSILCVLTLCDKSFIDHKEESCDKESKYHNGCVDTVRVRDKKEWV